ncbi:MAG: thioredoxin domain-containing protein, partial [Alphaproteobacteria bacterium]|nr:thioredoxin domain-containing protein [Alphaproteobacteria bacterium]
MRNDLDRETSPYLLQHKENPVHWQPWAAETLALAAAADKPILLSIGYAACHWCHVMSHESFENQETADLMNALFVNIKVDREERPDIDAIYMNALHLLGQQGGWPLTMFLTPQGEPFWGGTYFPPVSRWGRPSFPEVLRHIHTIFQTQREKILQNTVLIRDALEKMAQPDQAAPDPTDELFAQSARGALERVDLINGGINGAPKFPQVAVFEFLWRARARSGDRSFAQAVEVTLDHMCQGGIY